MTKYKKPIYYKQQLFIKVKEFKGGLYPLTFQDKIGNIISALNLELLN